MAKAEVRNKEKKRREKKYDIRDERRTKEENRDERQRRKGEEHNN